MKSVVVVFVVCALALATASPSLYFSPLALQHEGDSGEAPIYAMIQIPLRPSFNTDEEQYEDEEGPFMGKDQIPSRYYNVDDNDQNSLDDNDVDENDQQSSDGSLIRNKRQSRNLAMDLASSHRDRNGNDRPVGQIHGRVDANGFGQNGRNYHVNGGAGVGTVLHRSSNGRHTFGAGVYGSQSRGRYNGYNYRSRPSYGAGLGYTFRF